MIPFRSNSASARTIAWSLAIALAIVSVVPPDLRPETGVPHYFEHFLAFAAMGAAFGLGYERRPDALVIFLIAYCALIEIVQLVVPGRHARLLDFATDALAACLGVAAVSIVRILHSRSTRAHN